MRRLPPTAVVAVILSMSWASVADGQGFSPEESLKRMKVADGLQVKLVASEPQIRQPLSMTFDDRGRLWVLQYLQYPNPEGLKPVNVDLYLRTTYDKVPEPPPHGPRGADRITILEDPDEQGRFRKSKDFVTGLNLATGLALGHGGVFVVQPPYLLFYPDKNGDDVPDSDPEVLLKGFGMEDSHAFANSIQWGPDGWLYGAQGSTVTAKIRGIEFQQGIWRYHPKTKEFELFSEGGGNTWGLDFDRHGNVIAGTNYGNSTMLHQMQGAYHVKGFAKHGPLHNPHTYGYFEHVPYTGFKGGHVTCGGIIYQGAALPSMFNDQYIAGNLLSNVVNWHVVEPRGSSFVSRHGGEFLVANDNWFRAIDCLTGPDGAVYIADWYDRRANHVDPVDTWDKSNGRVYKVEKRGAPSAKRFSPLSRQASAELLGYLSHPNNWFRREARRILGERRDLTVVTALRQNIARDKGQLALESLWLLGLLDGLDDAYLGSLLGHANEYIRAWAVRLAGDRKAVDPSLAVRFVALAREDGSPIVRSQLACTAKRLPARDGLAIVRELLGRSEDATDVYIPLLLWWAIEDKAVANPAAVVGLLDDPRSWSQPIVKNFILERLGRRYLAEGTPAGQRLCAQLLDRAPDETTAERVASGMEKALEGKRLAQVPAPLAGSLAGLRSKYPGNRAALRLALRLGSPEAIAETWRLIGDPKAPDAERTAMLDILGQSGSAADVSRFLEIVRSEKKESLRGAALNALQGSSESRIADTLLAVYAHLSTSLRNRVQALLGSRPDSALKLLKAVDEGKIGVKEVSFEQVRQLGQFKDEAIHRILTKHWGKIGPQSSGEKLARVRGLNHHMNQHKGDPVQGKLLFQKHCAVCHTLFGEGNKVGPDLTTADRKNRHFLLTHIVDPNAAVRPEYQAHVVALTDGRTLTGLIVENGTSAVTLVDSKNERTLIARERIDEMLLSPVSLMPEKLLDTLNEPQVTDLFSYLQADGPIPGGTPAPAAKKAAKTLRVCLVSGSLEYESDASLTGFQAYLEKNFDVRCSRAFRKTDDDLPGLDHLDDCDVVVLFTRRLTISGEQLDKVKRYCHSGKPIVGIRTASHGFQNWLALDREILGGNYKGHYGAKDLPDIRIAAKDAAHPILKGVKPFQSGGSLYKNAGLSPDVDILLTGSIPGHTEPVAWTRNHKGGRVFYTSLGHQRDFTDPSFRRLVVNALYWTTQRDPAPRP